MRNISPSLNEKLKQQNQTHYNNANPKMNITIARARSSIIDSSYFNIEKIRTKEGIGDISIAARRLRPYGSPDRLYEIHIDNGIAKTAIREYPDEEREGWKSQFEIGEAKSVAVAFDGEWVLNEKLQWQIKTHEKPYIFWVDNDNVLKYRIWDEEGTTDELAIEVAKAKAIRAWKNANIKTYDQGLLVAYIKIDGKVYYRNFCEQEDGKYAWEVERKVEEFAGTAKNINLFITNDYRIGIVIEDSNGQIHWLITKRNWASMAISPEKIIVKPNIEVDFIETTKHKRYYIERITSKPNIALDFLYASSFNEFTHIENVSDVNGNFGKIIIFNTVYELFGINPLDFELIDERGIVFVASNISKISPLEYRLDFVDFNNAKGKVKLICKGDYTLNAAGYAFDNFEGTFMPENLVPDEVPAPQVTNVYNINDTEIIIEFDNELVFGVEGSLDAFSVITTAWKDIFEDVEITETHTITGIEQISGTQIKLILDVYTRLRRANTVTIKYDSEKGLITGETYPLASFEEMFVPDIEKILDPAEREKITVMPNISTDFIKVDYNYRYTSERITAIPNISVDFISVDEINP